ncbi:SMP-30/gluconolactonase/LRE family protein [Bauldia sp.]|uniref:SMP-30/gluconolactonase/LRE family protein n=1 Tax=Bauldia sp. TaxID=2575872 RepID=UPI003BAB7278
MICQLARVGIGALFATAIAGGAAAIANTLTVLNPDSAYPEGPLAHDGDLYYAEMGNDRVMRFDGEANAVFWSQPGCGPTAVAPTGDDGFVVLCHAENAVVRVDARGDTVSVIVADQSERGFPTPNAATGDRQGGIYFSSSGRFAPGAEATGAVIHLDANGRLRRVAEGIRYANGVAVSLERDRLYVSEHLARNVLVFDIAADGSLRHRRVFVRLDDLVNAPADRRWEVGPDGLAVDAAGNLYIAEYGAGRLLIVGSDGALIATVDVPEAYITSPALSIDEETLFITAPATMSATDGTVYRLANPVAAQAD